MENLSTKERAAVNIVFGRIHSKNSFEFIKDIIKRCGSKNNIGIIEDGQEVSETEAKEVFTLSFTRYYLDSGKFGNDDLYKETIPIDALLLDKMSACEWQIMEVASRNYFRDRSFKNRKDFYYKCVRYWNYILDKLDINLYIGMYNPHSFSELIIYYLCKIKKIKIIIFQRINLKNIDNYFYIKNDIDDKLGCLNKVFERFKSLDKSEFKKIAMKKNFIKVYEEYIEQRKDILPEYMKKTYSTNIRLEKLRDGVSLKERIKLALMLSVQLIFQFKHFRFNDYIKRELSLKDYLRQDRDAFSYYTEQCSEYKDVDHYIYIPLQTQPEETTLPRGGRYENQFLFIQMISACLPKNYWIIIKEHPAQRRVSKFRPLYRDIYFYKNLLKLGNVKFSHFDTSSYDLIRNSIAVATVTGTPGFEAICQGKPCLCFGKSFYCYAPGVYRIETLDECKQAVKEIVPRDYPEIKQEELKAYMLALSKISYRSSLHSSREISKYEADEGDELKDALFRELDKSGF